MKKNTNISTVGIIAEYNPFHNGHRYHIQKARQMAGADYVVTVMSGDFVQRGTPAIYDKYTRTAMALHSGADLVLEMPAAFATSSAEDFAGCGIALLDHLAVVDFVCFGSECGEINHLYQIADILAREPQGYTEVLKENLRLGLTYPEARLTALRACFKQDMFSQSLTEATLSQILHSPNNILGIEYCKALLRRNSSITPVTVSRKGHGYHDFMGMTEGFSSATGIRKAIQQMQGLESIRSEVPDEVFQLIRDKQFLPPSAFTSVLNTQLLRLVKSGEALCDYADVSEELEHRIRNMVYEHCSFEERSLQLKTRQYTYTRISRALLHLMLGIKKTDIEAYRKQDYAPYARVLGFRRAAAPLLRELKQHSHIPLITKTADAARILPPDTYRMLEQDFYCSHFYQAIYSSQHSDPVKNEFNRPLIIL